MGPFRLQSIFFFVILNTRCRHNSNGCCVHCSPIEPWDEAYLKEQKIKHLSFHAHIRKLTSGVDRGKFVALEDISCRIKSGCGDHPPWPKGICSKCQPSAITLNRQTYRHVDNVMFENTALVERFLNYWRTTGHQRLGYLYGTYEVNNAVPLGMTWIKPFLFPNSLKFNFVQESEHLLLPSMNHRRRATVTR